MTKRPRFFDLDDPAAKQELASEFMTRRGGSLRGALLVQSGIIRTADSGSRMEMDVRGLRGYDTAGTLILNFDTATGTLTVTGGIVAGGTITGAVITGGTLQTASSGKRVVIANPPGDRIDFYSGSADETSNGYILINVSGAAGGTAGVATWVTPSINSQDRASVSLTSESKDGVTSKSVVALSADTVLQVATTTSADTSLQLQGDLALFDSFSDPPTAAASYVRVFNSGGKSLRAISSTTTAPLWPIRAFVGACSGDLALTTTVTDVAGMTTGSFTTYAPNAIAIAWVFADFDVTTVGTGFNNVYINCSQGGTDDFSGACEDRVHREWVHGVQTYTLTTPGAFTIKARGKKNTAGGASAVKINSRLVVLVIG